jgi:hypothetical protein
MIRRRVGISTLARHSTKAAGLLSNCRRLGPDIAVCERFEKIDEVGFLLCGQLEVADLAIEQRQNLITGSRIGRSAQQTNARSLIRCQAEKLSRPVGTAIGKILRVYGGENWVRVWNIIFW